MTDCISGNYAKPKSWNSWYYISTSLTAVVNESAMALAINEIQSKTCVKIVRRNGNSDIKSYIAIQTGNNTGVVSG
jgi:hypothetical protein